MYICKNCGQTYAEHTNFCSVCGSNAIELQNYAQPEEQNFFNTPTSLSGDGSSPYSAPAYSEPTYSSPAYSEPAYSSPAYSEPTYSSPAYSEPAYSSPAYSEPVYSKPYTAPSPSKAPAIVGMICSIIALCFGLYLIGFSITSAAIYEDYSYSYSYYNYRAVADAAAFCLGFISVFQIPLTVVGLIMSFKAKALKAMGIVGIITGFLSVLLWFISCIVVMSM